MASLTTFPKVPPSRSLTTGGETPLVVPASEPAPFDAVRLGRYSGFLRRQWPVLLGATALGSVLGMGWSATTHHTYTSTISVLAPPVAVESGLPSLGQGPFAPVDQKPVLETMDTEAQLVTSGLVLEQLKRVPGFHVPPDRLAERVSVTVASPYSRAIVIAVSANHPGNARQGARVIARTYVKLRSRVIGQYQTRNRQTINRRLLILQRELKALPPDPSALPRITARTRRQAIQLQILEAKKQLAYTDQFAEVLRAPDRPTHPDDPGSAVNRTSGMGIGLLAGFGIGLVRDRRPRRLRYARDVRRRIPVPILTDTGREDLADSGRRLRNLAFAEDARTVLVTGMPGETAGAVAVSVAAAFAHGGAPTTLLRVSDEPVPDFSGGQPSQEGERDDGLGSFRVVALAADDGDRGLADAVGRAHHDAGVVVISGSGLDTAEAVTLAALSDITLVTIALKRVTDRPLTAAIAHLVNAGAPPRGIVITHGNGTS
jgi:capsular polysaccharide biosynthesis protein